MRIQPQIRRPSWALSDQRACAHEPVLASRAPPPPLHNTQDESRGPEPTIRTLGATAGHKAVGGVERMRCGPLGVLAEAKVQVARHPTTEGARHQTAAPAKRSSPLMLAGLRHSWCSPSPHKRGRLSPRGRRPGSEPLSWLVQGACRPYAVHCLRSDRACACEPRRAHGCAAAQGGKPADGAWAAWPGPRQFGVSRVRPKSVRR